MDSWLESVVATFTHKHENKDFACDTKVLEEQAKATKNNKKLKNLALAGMYAACMSMHTKIKKLEGIVCNKNITISEREKENTALKSQVQSLSTLNQILNASQEENLKKYQLAQK